jgi:hypothetical protein
VSDKFDAETIAKATASPRWSTLVRTGVDAATVGTWDPRLVRDTRVLVPIDVQALYVPAGSTEPMCRVPLALAAADGEPPAAATPVLEDGPPREAGVHLHWLPPDALMRGSFDADRSTNRLGLATLPDRWVVVRVLVPKGQQRAHVRGWVIEADTAKAVPIDEYPVGAAAAPQAGRTVPPADLNGSAGGSLNWVAVYDATINRLAFFDPLDDLAAVAPSGVEGDHASYVVAGWWSSQSADPLDGAHTTANLHSRLHDLGWALTDDHEGGDQLHVEAMVRRLKQESLGLASATRYTAAAPPTATSTPGIAAGPAPGASPIDDAIKPRVFTPVTGVFADVATNVVQTEPSWPRATLLHGCVFGVPVSGPATTDNRPPSAEGVSVVFGEQSDDLAAVLASTALGSADPDERRSLERLLAAFTGHLLDRVGTSDGLVDIEEHEHNEAFVARQGGAGGTDRLQSGRQSGGFAAGRQARSAAARKSAAPEAKPTTGAHIASFAASRAELKLMTRDTQRTQVVSWAGDRPGVEVSTEAREVVRPAPRLYVPAETMVAIRGAGRSLRFGAAGRFSQDGLVHCRWPSQVVRGLAQVIDARDLVPPIATGATPSEVQALVDECVTLDPYLAPWLAGAAAARHQLDKTATTKRVVAEAALRFGIDAVYDAHTSAFQPAPVGTIARRAAGLTSALVADELRRFSMVAGTDPYPVGITAWSQPWVPLWLEWEIRLDIADTLDGWTLGALDYERVVDQTLDTVARTLRGRSVLTSGTATTLGSAVRDWLAAEEQRDQQSAGEVDDATADALSNIASATEHLDVLATSLDGVREQLLGLVYDGGLVRPRQGDGTFAAPATSGAPPAFLRAGTMTITKARLVDAFGRTLDLPVDRLAVPTRSDVTGAPQSLEQRPRLTLPTRALLRFVDPAAEAATATEARVDQVDATQAINPVAAFLLPDHIDEALEIFDTAGAPLGQLTHEPFGGGVVWEIAPGRPGPADAGPLFGVTGGTTHAGLLAAGLVAADAKQRRGQPASDDHESALSALLRAIDTTLWTTDAFASLGTEHIAGLVGRPIAVVRARLSLELAPDIGADPIAAAAALADRAFTMRIGELTRADDGLLAYFVDDDYEHVHLVDKVIAAEARESGRQRGQQARYGEAPAIPEKKPIDHPYVVSDDALTVRFGQTLALTLLMLPAGKVHLTSGVVPRKSVQLAREWVTPGLSVIAPSARIGPVLVDPAQIRLPLISAFPKKQIFTRRDTPQSWKDDPILAATQSALLPDLPHEVQEGYIRIAPNQEDDPQ